MQTQGLSQQVLMAGKRHIPTGTSSAVTTSQTSLSQGPELLLAA